MKITAYDDLIDETQKEILSAGKEILLRIWSEDFDKMEEQLKKAESKGIDIQLLSFTPLKTPLGEYFRTI